MTGLGVRGELSRGRGRCAPPGRGPFNVDAPGPQAGRRALGPAGLRTRAGLQASLAQANILHSWGGAAGDLVAGDVGSSLRRKGGLRSSAPQGPVLPARSRQAPVRAGGLGPAPSDTPAE